MTPTRKTPTRSSAGFARATDPGGRPRRGPSRPPPKRVGGKAPLRVAYPRDLVGYGKTPPDPKWPGGARLALQIGMNYEEGGERSILHGDGEAEAFLQEVVGMPVLKRVRTLQVESMYDSGTRAGFWRLLRIFARHAVT